MSPLWKAKEQTSKMNIAPYILPAYIIFSAVFIIYMAYWYVNGVVYRSGQLSGQQVGYEAAIKQLMQQVGTQCEPVSINYEDQVVNVVNVACLQAPQAEEVPNEG